MSSKFEVIADQATSAHYIADCLLTFAQDHKMYFASPDAMLWNRLAAPSKWDENTDGDPYEVLEEFIEEVNAVLDNRGTGLEVGWHPDECGTLICAISEWWNQ